MPVYDYECPRHGTFYDVWANISDESLPCPDCGANMIRLISLPNINPDIEPYWDENLGHDPIYVQSRQHRQSLMEDRGLCDRWGAGSPKKQRWV